MQTNKTSLAVAALQAGTVIDHIPSDSLFDAVKILGIERLDEAVTIGNNLSSRKHGRKGIIKVSNVEFDDSVLNRIALIAPQAKVNIIRDYAVVEKRTVELPPVIVDLVRCGNPKCISNNEPMASKFEVVSPGTDADATDPDQVVIRCCYCGRCVTSKSAIIK